MNEVQKELMTDDDLCAMLAITKATLMRHLRHGPPRMRHGAAAGDVRTIRHINVGSQRRWVRKSVDLFINGETA